MKIPLPDAKSPPSPVTQRAALLVGALLLLPYAFGSGLSWRSVWAAAIWAFCAGIMEGIIGRQNKAATAAARGWDNFISAGFMFVLALGFTGMTAFPLLRNDNWTPLWWFGVAALVTAGQIAFALKVLPHFTGCFNRGLLVFTVPFLMYFNVWTLGCFNGAFDWSEVEIQRAVVVSKGISKSSKGGPAYIVRFRLDDGALAKSRVTRKFYNGTVAGQTLEIRTKRGALSAPWIVEVL